MRETWSFATTGAGHDPAGGDFGDLLRRISTAPGQRGAAMTDPAARAAALLAEHRTSIDRLDAILVYTLAERFKRTQAVGRLKAEHDLPPSDPVREARQIERLEWLSKEADLDPEFARKFLTFIISEVIRHHEKLQK
jgi:chorismate mutase